MPEFTLPSAEEAMGTLDTVYARVFFAKMAEYGHVPQTEADAHGMLESALAIDAVPESVTKQGAVGSYSAANNNLQTKLAAAGLQTPRQSFYDQQAAQATKQASAAFAAYPEVYKAVLAVQAAEAA